MRTSLALLALAATAFAVPQAVTEDIAPKDGPPKGCTASYDGKFEVTIFTPGKSKRDITEVSHTQNQATLVTNLLQSDLATARAFSS